MIIHGRISLFGEYLMHQHAPGLVLPTRLVLASGYETNLPLHPDYDADRDTVRRLLLLHGYAIGDLVRGDLPFGYGFASSTALGFLHLDGKMRDQEQRLLTAEDGRLQGFDPSGVDVAYCKRQTSGLFMRGRWRNVTVSGLGCTALLLPKEGQKRPAVIRERIVREAASLSLLASMMAESVRGNGGLKSNLLLEYCERLVACDAYSKSAMKVVQALLREGVCAKAVGALYDKAIIMVHWFEASRVAILAREVAATIEGSVVLDDILPVSCERLQTREPARGTQCG